MPYDILQLNDMLVPELIDVAENLKINNARTLDKQSLIYKILDQQALGTQGSNNPETGGDDKKRRSRKPKAETKEPATEEEKPEKEKEQPANEKATEPEGGEAKNAAPGSPEKSFIMQPRKRCPRKKQMCPLAGAT